MRTCTQTYVFTCTYIRARERALAYGGARNEGRALTTAPPISSTLVFRPTLTRSPRAWLSTEKDKNKQGFAPEASTNLAPAAPKSAYLRASLVYVHL